MKAFDPGGAPGQVSGEFSSVQVWDKRKLFRLGGLKEDFLLDNLEKRVLHSTCRATHHFIARAEPLLLLEDPIKRTHFSHVPNKGARVNQSEKSLNLPDGSFCTQENDDSSIEQQHGARLVESSCVKNDLDNIESNTSPAHFRQMQEHLSDSDRSSNEPVCRHQEASFLHSSKSNSSSRHVFDIPGPSELHPHGITEFLLEDPEAPSTPDLQPESRFWDCEVPCNNYTDDMSPPVSLLLEKEDIMETCLIQSPRNNNPAQEEGSCVWMKQGECVGRHAELSYMNDNNSCGVYRGKTNSNHLFHSALRLKPTGCRRRMVHKMVYSLKVFALKIHAATRKKQLYSRSMHLLWARLVVQRLLRMVESKRYNLQGEALREQSWAGIQAYLQCYKARSMLGQGHRVAANIQVSSAACFLRRLVRREVYAVKKACIEENRASERMSIEMSMREQAVIVLQAFTRGYLLARKEFSFRRHSLSKSHSIEHSDVRTCKIDQCNSVVSSLGDVNAAFDLPRPLKSKEREFLESAEPLDKVLDACIEDFTKSHRSLPWKEKTHPISIERKVDDWNNIPIDQVDECLDTCLLHLRLPPPFFPSESAPEPMLLDLAVNNSMRELGKISNMTCSSSNRINGQKDYFDVYINSNGNEAVCMPSVEHGQTKIDYNDAPSQSVSEAHPDCLSCEIEELRSSRVNGRVHERQSKEKLEHFAEVFLLRRHIVQQQRRAQQAPPYPPQVSIEPADNVKGSGSRVVADMEAIQCTCSPMEASMKNIEHGKHEHSVNATSTVTEASESPSNLCDYSHLIGADVVVDVVGLLKHVDIQSSQVGMLIGAAAKSDGCTHMPTTHRQLVVPNVTAVIVTIVAMVVYTRMLCQGALAWVGARPRSKEKN